MRSRLWGAANLLAVALVAWLWVLTYDDASMPPRAVLGGYRERWFVLNAALTYATLWSWVFWIVPIGRTGRLRFVGVHLAVILTVLCLEAVAFFGLVDYQAVADDVARRALGRPDLSQPNLRIEGETYPDLVYYLGVEAEKIPYVFETDANGFRNPPGVVDPRVVCVGDSIVVAGLLPLDQVLTSRLGEALGVSVMNLGRDGVSPQGAFGNLREVGVSLEGTIVLQLVFEGNDLEGSKTWRRLNPGAVKSYARTIDDPQLRRTWPDSGLARALLRRLKWLKGGLVESRTGTFVKADGEPVRVSFFYDAQSVNQHLGEVRHLVKFFERARRRVESRGGRYAVVIVPAKFSVVASFCRFPESSPLGRRLWQESHFAEHLVRECEERAIPYVDLTPALRSATGEGKLVFFPADTHLDATGHAIMAETLAPFARRLLADLGQPGAESRGSR